MSRNRTSQKYSLTKPQTYLSAIVVNFLKQEYGLSDVPVLCLYLDPKDFQSNEHTLENLFGNLLWQLMRFRGLDAVSETSKRLYPDVKDGKRLQLSRIIECIKAELEPFDRCFIVVDGLDNCSSSNLRDDLEDELDKLKSLGMLRLMLTSRDTEFGSIGIKCEGCQREVSVYYRCKLCDDGNFDVCQKCKDDGLTCQDPTHELIQGDDCIGVEVRAPASDITLYLNWMIDKEMKKRVPKRRDERVHPKRLRGMQFGDVCRNDPQVVQKIHSVVSWKAGSSFLVAELYIECLKRELRKSDIYDALDKLPDSLVELYKQILNQIANDNQKGKNLAHEILSRIFCARRDLSIEELQYVLAVGSDVTRIDEDSLYSQADILATTRGLVTIFNHQDAVRLCHDTLHEYLNDESDQLFTYAELEMAEACLTYLTIEDCPKSRRDDEEFSNIWERFPFIAYASQFWGEHLRVASLKNDRCEHVQDTAFNFITSPNLVAAYIQAAFMTAKSPLDSWDVRRGINGLHLCAWFGLSTQILRLLNDKPQVRAQHSEHEDTPPLLTPEGQLDIDVQERTYGQTPLMYACRNGHSDVAWILLQNGASISSVSERGRTALFEAILAGQEDTVQALLNYDVKNQELNINARQVQQSDRTALMLAIREHYLTGMAEIVTCLLNHPKIDVNLQDLDGHTALIIAASNNFTEAVHALVERPELRINLVEKKVGRSALMYAASGDHPEMAEKLLENGANPEMKDVDGNTALILAATYGCTSVVEMFCRKGSGLHDTDETGRGAIHRASVGGHLQVIQLLHQSNVDVNLQCRDGGTPLHDASRHGGAEAAKALLEYGANTKIRDNLGRTPAGVAREYGYEEVVNVLRKASADTDVDCPAEADVPDLPIWSLARTGKLDAIEEMIKSRPHEMTNVEPDTNDTALHSAVTANKTDALKTLLESDCIPVDSSNRYQRTPLHLAALFGNGAATTILIDHQPQLNLRDKWGNTALSLAYSNKVQKENHFPIALALIAAGATPDQNIVSPMFLEATECGNIDAVRELTMRKPDILCRNIKGMTALQIAKRKGNAELERAVASCPSFYFQPEPKRGKSESSALRTGEKRKLPVESMEQLHGSTRIRPFRSRDWTL